MQQGFYSSNTISMCLVLLPHSNALVRFHVQNRLWKKLLFLTSWNWVSLSRKHTTPVAILPLSLITSFHLSLYIWQISSPTYQIHYSILLMIVVCVLFLLLWFFFFFCVVEIPKNKVEEDTVVGGNNGFWTPFCFLVATHQKAFLNGPIAF